MSEPKSELQTLKGAWNPFMCPACRGLFRAPSGAQGATVCPLCKSKVSVNSAAAPSSNKNQPETTEALEDSVSQPVVTPQAAPPTAELEAPQPPVRRRKQSSSPAKSHKWEGDKSSTRSRSSGSKGLVASFLFIFSIALAVGAVYLFKDRLQGLGRGGKDAGEAQKKIDYRGGESRSGRLVDIELPEERKDFLKSVPTESYTAKVAMDQFLRCENVEDLATYIREPRRVMPLVRKYYQETPLVAEGARSFDTGRNIEVAKNFVSFRVVLKDYSHKNVAIELTDDGPKVDWESWVSYCELPWENFIEEQVNETTTVRVNVARDSYYNFAFRDDTQWVCYRLSRGPDDEVIFGYLPIDSPLVRKLPRELERSVSTILKVKFPKNPVSKDQVLITNFVASGWVLGL